MAIRRFFYKLFLVVIPGRRFHHILKHKDAEQLEKASAEKKSRFRWAMWVAAGFALVGAALSVLLILKLLTIPVAAFYGGLTLLPMLLSPLMAILFGQLGYFIAKKCMNLNAWLKQRKDLPPPVDLVEPKEPPIKKPVLPVKKPTEMTTQIAIQRLNDEKERIKSKPESVLFGYSEQQVKKMTCLKSAIESLRTKNQTVEALAPIDSNDQREKFLHFVLFEHEDSNKNKTPAATDSNQPENSSSEPPPMK